MSESQRITLYAVTVPENALAALLPQVQVLDPEERAMFDRYRVDFKKVEFLTGRLLLKKFLAQHLNCAPAAVRFVKNDYGKLFLTPELERKDAPLHFNLTHSGQMIVVAFTPYAEVGVDVEETTKDHLNLMPSVYQPHEIEWVDGKPTAEQQRAFYLLWTRKEAYMKARGMGMSIPPLSFTVPLSFERSQLAEWEYMTFAPTEAYMISTCLAKQPDDELSYELHQLSLHDLLAL